jgi:hypothetical protein
MKLNKTEQIIGTIISILTILLFFIYVAFGIIGFGDEGVILTFIALVFFSTTIVCFTVFFRLRQVNKLAEINYLNIGIHRYLLGLFMVFYGVPKLFGAFFDYQLFALDTKLIEVSDFELAWYYFGKNNWQELISGILEFIPGVLLFYRRTYYFASLVLLFVTSQVFFLNLFFKIGGITLPAATILLACNIYLIYSQKERILAFFKSLSFLPTINLNKKTTYLVNTLRGLALLMAFFIIFIKAKPHLYKSTFQVKYDALIGKFTLEKVSKNNQNDFPKEDSTLYKDLYIEKQSRWNLLRDFNEKTSAFVLEINENNDSLKIYLNKGGFGDDADVIDSSSVLKGIYKLTDNELLINGIQSKDTLNLIYKRQDLKPKKWLW